MSRFLTSKGDDTTQHNRVFNKSDPILLRTAALRSGQRLWLEFMLLQNRQMFWTLWGCTDYGGESWCGWSQGEYFNPKKVCTLSLKERKLWRGHQYPYESKMSHWDWIGGGSQMEGSDWKSVRSSTWMHCKRRRRNYEEKISQPIDQLLNKREIKEFLDRHLELSRVRMRPSSHKWCWQIETPDMVFV